MHARFQKTLKRQGCFLAMHGGILIPLHVPYTFAVNHAGSPCPHHECQSSATPVAARGLAPEPPQLRHWPRLPEEAAPVWLFPRVYVCKRHAGALAASGNEFRGTNPFTGFPKQTNELKREQRCTAPNHLPTALGICLRHSRKRFNSPCGAENWEVRKGSLWEHNSLARWDLLPGTLRVEEAAKQ